MLSGSSAAEIPVEGEMMFLTMFSLLNLHEKTHWFSCVNKPLVFEYVSWNCYAVARKGFESLCLKRFFFFFLQQNVAY